MKIEFDPVKNAKNIKERNFSFDLVAQFEIDSAYIQMDLRQNYGELRFNMTGFISINGLDDQLFFTTITMRSDVVRVISLRKANNKEKECYALNH